MTLAKLIQAGAPALSALVMAAAANAADLYSGGGYKDAPPPIYIPAPMWTGLYFGAHAGADWSSLQTGQNVWNDGHVNSGHKHDTLAAFGGNNLNSTGAFGGGQIGYNYQISSFVLGLEADLGAMGNTSQNAYSLAALNGSSGALSKAATIALKSEGGLYGDVTGRVGLAWGPALFYAKGGFAWLNDSLKASSQIVDATVTPAAIATASRSQNAILDGWTVGGGLEYMLGSNWTMKAEYLHFDFNNANQTWAFDANNTWRVTGKDLNVDTVKLGFNYLINSGPAPLK